MEDLQTLKIVMTYFSLTLFKDVVGEYWEGQHQNKKQHFLLHVSSLTERQRYNIFVFSLSALGS
jgi:hypothetical protein